MGMKRKVTNWNDIRVIWKLGKILVLSLAHSAERARFIAGWFAPAAAVSLRKNL